MFIQTEETPNPATLKFIPDGHKVLDGAASQEFKNQQQAAKKSPLAMQIFEIKGVEAVFLGADFITITKSGNANWKHLTPEIQAVIMDFFMSGREVIFDSKKTSADADKKGSKDNSKHSSGSDENDSEIVKQIKELIEIKVRPAVAMDGGDINFHSFEDGVVYLVLKGSCSGCPSSTITLKNGIENMLKHYIPEVEAVEQIQED